MATPADATPRLYRRRWIPRAETPAVAVAGGVVIAALVLIAVIAPLIAPSDPNAVDLGNTLAPPSSDHVLGTDASGDRKSTRLNSSHIQKSRMPSSA